MSKQDLFPLTILLRYPPPQDENKDRCIVCYVSVPEGKCILVVGTTWGLMIRDCIAPFLYGYDKLEQICLKRIVIAHKAVAQHVRERSVGVRANSYSEMAKACVSMKIDRLLAGVLA